MKIQNWQVITLAHLIFLAWGVAGSELMAVQPSLSSINPQGIRRGEETEVVFGGARLSDVQQLLLYSPGIEIVQLEAASDTQVKAKLKVAADCRLGIHAVRLCTKTGITNLRTFAI